VPDDAVDSIAPLMTLWEEVKDGTIDIGYAERQSRHVALTQAELSVPFLVTASEYAVKLAHSGDWPSAIILARICAAAADAGRSKGSVAEEGFIVVAADLVEVARVVLCDRGDYRVYAMARAIGDEAVAATTNSEGWSKLRGRVLYRLGTMMLDAYITGRSPGGYEHEHQLWLQRAFDATDFESLGLASDEVSSNVDEKTNTSSAPAATMPDPLEGLSDAERYLRDALAVTMPARRPYVLKALSQAMEWEGWLGEDVDLVELVALCREALGTLPSDDATTRQSVRGTLRRAESASTTTQVTPRATWFGDDSSAGVPAVEPSDGLASELETYFDDFVEAHGETVAWDAVNQALDQIASDDPERGLRILRLQRKLTHPWEEEAVRARHYEAELRLLIEAYAPGWAKSFDVSAIRDAAARALAEASNPPRGSTARQRAAANVAVMARAGAADQEGVALQLQRACRLSTIDKKFAREHGKALFYLLAGLHQGAAVNELNYGDDTAAVASYTEAAERFIACRLTSSSLHCCRGIDDILKRRRVDDVTSLAGWLFEWGLILEILTPGQAPEWLHFLCGHAMTIAVKGPKAMETVLVLLQAAKGRMESAWLAAGAPDFVFDQRCTDLLMLIESLEREVPLQSSPLRPSRFGGVFDEDLMLTAFAGMGEEAPSETADDRLANAQRAFERHAMQLLTKAVSVEEAPPVSIAQIQNALDPETVLLQLYEGRTLEDELAIVSVVSTRERNWIGLEESTVPVRSVLLQGEGYGLVIPQLADLVARIRQELQRDPRPRNVTREAETLLSDLSEIYFRPVVGLLEELLTSGKKHLLIAPHGPLRFLPLDLAGPAGHPLADDWVVTYLGNLRELLPLCTPVAQPRREGVAVFGLSYEDRPQMPPLRSSAEEACAIATTLGVEPTLDEAATASAFARALEQSRYLHVRAHGRHNVASPLFQTVFLSPEEGRDGRFRAYEALPLDLRGLELVTLSACETALGRIDRSDNGRGLPSALMAAGAQAVVGTLWPVLADASALFFAELYARLVPADRPLWEAYGEARRAVQAKFPAHRDWSAFYLLGGAESSVRS
jgi:CHAT domain-containing protein